MKRLIIFADKDWQCRDYLRAHWPEVSRHLREPTDPPLPDPPNLRLNDAYVYAFDEHRLKGLDPNKCMWVQITPLHDSPSARYAWIWWATMCRTRGLNINDQPKFPEY